MLMSHNYTHAHTYAHMNTHTYIHMHSILKQRYFPPYQQLITVDSPLSKYPNYRGVASFQGWMAAKGILIFLL